MKFTRYSYQLQLKHTFTVSGHSRTATPLILVELNHDGVIGYGEASMPPYLGESQASVQRFLEKIDFSRFSDPFQIEEILNYVDCVEQGNTAAKASIDIALHDLVGKLLHAPWHRVWELNKNATPYSSFTIGIDSPDVVKRKTEEVAGQYKILKIKVGTDRDREIVKAVREISNLPIVADANQGWKDKYYARDMISWLYEMGCMLIEQPMPKEQLDDVAWVTQHSPIPVIADESVQRLVDVEKIRGAFSGINIKLMKCTGMREAWKMITLARVYGMYIMIGCMTETSCAVSAAAQLAPLVDFADLDGNLLINNDPFDGVKIVNGKIELNDRPGVGVEKILNVQF